MKKLLIAALAGLALALPLSSMGAPDEAQKQMIQRAQEAKRSSPLRRGLPAPSARR